VTSGAVDSSRNPSASDESEAGHARLYSSLSRSLEITNLGSIDLSASHHISSWDSSDTSPRGAAGRTNEDVIAGSDEQT
jgi:hypothetical protein